MTNAWTTIRSLANWEWEMGPSLDYNKTRKAFRLLTFSSLEADFTINFDGLRIDCFAAKINISLNALYLINI